MPKSLKLYKNKELRQQYRNRQRRRNYEKSNKFAVNGYNPYSSEECQLILEHNITDFELSKQLGRSMRAIQGKRFKLKKELENNSAKLE